MAKKTEKKKAPPKKKTEKKTNSKKTTVPKTKQKAKPAAKAPARGKTGATSKLKSAEKPSAKAKSNEKSSIKLPAVLSETHARNKSMVKSAYIALLGAWIFAVLPIPGLSYMGLAVCNIVAIILGIVNITRDEVKTGIIVLVGALVGSPVMYMIGWGLMMMIGISAY